MSLESGRMASWTTTKSIGFNPSKMLSSKTSFQSSESPDVMFHLNNQSTVMDYVREASENNLTDDGGKSHAYNRKLGTVEVVIQMLIFCFTVVGNVFVLLLIYSGRKINMEVISTNFNLHVFVIKNVYQYRVG